MIDQEDIGSNTSNNTHLDEVIAERISRRDFVAGSAAMAATSFLGGSLLASGNAEAAALSCPSPASIDFQLGFTEVAVSTVDDVIVPPGYTAQVLAPWGTPLLRNAPAFKEDASNTAAEQAMQVGFNHDGMHFFPNTRFPNTRGLLVMNHEYTDADQIYTAAQGSNITADADGQEKVAKALAGHGVSVIAITKSNGSWKVVKGEYYNRRITGNTPVSFSGPVRLANPALQSTITPAPLGTLNNCAHGYTPWGTYLACEENFNGYFGTDDATWTPDATQSRYGLSKTGFGYDWHKAEPRFDLAVNPNEANRFGWVVEIDPFRPASRPVKRTAMGRFKHEGATWREDSQGRIVFYMGDDENGDYLYRYVSARPWRDLIAEGLSPLDVGTLYVAKFNGDGTGLWLALKHGTGVLTVGNSWLNQADVLLRTRLAADAVGATKLHRPEWVAVHPRTQEGYVALTNGSGNGAPVNSGRDPNPYGHILRFRDSEENDQDLTWDIYLVAGDPAYDSAVPADQPAFGSPDGLWFDSRGILWIQTDISNSSQNRADRKYDGIGNNQMLAANPDTGELKRFLTGPRGCEVTGVVMTPDMKTMFVNIQHPGESTTYWNNITGTPSVSNPSAVSSWPNGGSSRPRPATVVIEKIDGGVIGS